MKVKMCPLLIIAMFLLLVVMPAAAYDYRGVPRPGDNNPGTQEEEMVADDTTVDLSAENLSTLFDSDVLTGLIMMILNIILKLFGASYS